MAKRKRKKSMYSNLDEGAFTRKAKRAGMSVQAFASKVKANPGRYSLKTRRQANFAKTQKKIANRKKRGKK